MNKLYSYILLLLIFPACTIQENHPLQKFSDNLPGNEAIMLESEILLVSEANQNGTFSPDFKEFIFTKHLPEWQFIPFYTKLTKKGWTKPDTAIVYKKLGGQQPFFSPDGEKLFFIRNRDFLGEPADQADIWYLAQKQGKKYKAINIGPPVNTKYAERNPTISLNGTLVFYSNREGGYGGFDIYYAEYDGMNFSEPVNLGTSVNTSGNEFNPCISPNGDYLIYNTYQRPDTIGGQDLFITFRLVDGSWSNALNLGEKINTSHGEWGANITADGKYLLFTSRKNDPFRKPDIFWIKTDFIYELKKNVINNVPS